MVGILKTRAEIDRLIEIVDANRDGEVSTDELAAVDKYALVAEGLGITDYESLHFFTTLYKPGTEVVRNADGTYIATDEPQSLRAECVAAYEDNFLLDAILNIEGRDVETMEPALQKMEEDWVALHYEESRRPFNTKTVRENFVKYSQKNSFDEMGLKVDDVAAKFSTADLKLLKEGVTLMEFVAQQNVFYDYPQMDFFKFIEGYEKVDLSTMERRKEIGHNGTCTVVVAWALHFLKLVENKNIELLLISDHVTLCIQTSQGPVYLDPAGGQGFQPPYYYDSGFWGPNKTVHRGSEDALESWQIFAAVYGNIGSSYIKRASQIEGFDESARAGRDVHYKNALKYFGAALEIYPDDVTANYNYGRTLARLDDREGARHYYNRALAINPHYQQALTALGE